MKTSSATLIGELDHSLAQLRQQRHLLSWVNVPRLIQNYQKLRRVMHDATRHTERIALQRELQALMQRAQGIWQGLRGHTSQPVWLKEGAGRQQGMASAQAIQKFFTHMKRQSELRRALGIIGKRPWSYHTRRHTKYRLLLRREEQANEKLPAVRARLWQLAAVVRALAKNNAKIT